MGGVVAVRTRYARQRFTLVPPTFTNDPVRGLMEADRGARFRAEAGRVEIPAALENRLMEHPAFTGQGQEKTLWLEGDFAAPAAPQGVQVVDGARATASQSPREPKPGWESMTLAAVKDTAAGMSAQEIRGALVWESTRQARPGVLEVLGRALRGAGDPDPEPDTDQAAEPPVVPVPGGVI